MYSPRNETDAKIQIYPINHHFFERNDTEAKVKHPKNVEPVKIMATL